MCLPQSTVRDPFTSNLLLTQSWLSEEPKLTQSSSLPITSLPLDTRVFLMPWLGLWSSLVLDEVMWRHRASEGSLPTSTVGYLYLKEQKGWGYKLGGWEWMRWEMGMEEGTPRKGEKGLAPPLSPLVVHGHGSYTSRGSAGEIGLISLSIPVVLSLQLCLILCDPMDCSPPGSCVHGILQARITEAGCQLLLQKTDWWLPKGINCCTFSKTQFPHL